MLIVFFDYHGVVFSGLVPNGSMVNNWWRENSWILHHDVAPSHKAHIVNTFLTKNSTNIIEQQPYSPDLAPCDFCLFLKLKLPLRGRPFKSIGVIKENLLKEQKKIYMRALKRCFGDWTNRWHMCIASNRAYFQGDKINFGD